MLHECTRIDPWFLQQFAEIAELEKTARMLGLRAMSPELLLTLKRAGFGDLELAGILGVDESAVRQRRLDEGFVPAYKRIDTCAAEFESFTPYMYGSYEPFCESDPNPKKKVVILGSGPNRIGQGIEFDYCCCHAAFALREEGFETVMINCNPETVSTDYDTTDRLYFEPLTFEDVMAVLDKERCGWCRGRLPGAVRRADAAEAGAAAAGGGDRRFSARRPIRSIWPKTAAASRSCCGISASRSRPAARPPHAHEARDVARNHRLPGRRAPVVRARRPRHGDRLRHGHARPLHGRARWTCRTSGPC